MRKGLEKAQRQQAELQMQLNVHITKPPMQPSVKGHVSRVVFENMDLYQYHGDGHNISI